VRYEERGQGYRDAEKVGKHWIKLLVRLRECSKVWGSHYRGYQDVVYGRFGGISCLLLVRRTQ
jgi:hypothetical protein